MDIKLRLRETTTLSDLVSLTLTIAILTSSAQSQYNRLLHSAGLARPADVTNLPDVQCKLEIVLAPIAPASASARSRESPETDTSFSRVWIKRYNLRVVGEITASHLRDSDNAGTDVGVACSRPRTPGTGLE